MSSPVLYSRGELEHLTPRDRWVLEERLDEAQEMLREFNDEELRHWVEIEGKTLTWVAQQVGRSVGRISRRCSALGIEPDKSRGGRPKVLPPQNPDEEVIDSEVVEDDPPGPRKTKRQERLIGDVLHRMELLESTVGEIDFDTVKHFPKEKREAWLLRFKKIQSELTRLKNALA